MSRIPPLQLARELAEFIMVMNANNRSFSSEILDELAVLHLRMKQEAENPRAMDVEHTTGFPEGFEADMKELTHVVV